MQSQIHWTVDSGPGTFPRIPVGYSYTQPQPLPGDALFCPHCRSPWSSEILLQSHLRAVHHQQDVISPTPPQMTVLTEDHADGAFLLDGVNDLEDEGESEAEDSQDISAQLLDRSDEDGPSAHPAQLGSSEETVTHTQEGNQPPAEFSCSRCPGVAFQTKREFDLHTSVVHILSPLEPTTPQTEVTCSVVEVLKASSSTPGLPLGFSGSPKVSNADSSPVPELLDELACKWCPSHKRGNSLPSKDALYQHLLSVHLRCPAPLVSSACAAGPFPSRDTLCKHVQAVHLLCPDCVHEPFRSHAAVHKHVQTAHSRCSFCSRGSYASSKALSDHVRAAHTSQHLRSTPSIPAKVVLPHLTSSSLGLKPGALYYVTDTDGLDYLAQVTQVPEEGTSRVQIQWIGFDSECLVPVTSVSRAVDLSVGALLVVNLGREGEDCEQGELVEADPSLGQYSVRLLTSGAQYSIGLEHLLDVVSLRSKQPCLALNAEGTLCQAEIVSADPPTRSCSVRWSPKADGIVGKSTKAATMQISYDDLRHVLDIRKGFHCAVHPSGEVPYEAQIQEVFWSQGECRIGRSDSHQEAIVPMSALVETWRGDHVLDEKGLILAELPATALTDDLETMEAREEEEEETPTTGLFKPNMRYPVVPPDEKSKTKKDRKKKEEKEREPAEGVPKAPFLPDTSSPPYPSPAPGGQSPPAAAYLPGYSYSAEYPATAGYSPAQFAGFYGYGTTYPGYPVGYGTGYGGHQMPYPSGQAGAPPTPYGAGGKGASASGRGDGRRQGQGEGSKMGRGRGKGQRTGKGDDLSQSQGRFESQQGWSSSGPQPHRSFGGRLYHQVVYDKALEEQRRTPQVMLPHLPEVPRVPATRMVGDWALKFVRSVAPTEEEVKKRQDLRSRIQKVLQIKMGRSNLQLLPYGSASTGLMERSSELDLCLILENFNCGMSLLQVTNLLSQAANVLKAEGVEGIVTNHFEEQFPYIHFAAGDKSFQISMSMYCAVRSSALIRQYVIKFPLVRPLVMVIVGWAKRAGIHSRRDGLNTYVLTLMVLHYLIRAGDIAPVPIEMQLPPANDVCSFIPIAETFDTTRLGMYVLGFFQFYSTGFQHTEHVVTIRTAFVVTKQSKQWGDPLAVEDPFEVFINTAQCITPMRWPFVKQAIDSAYRLLYESKVAEFLPEIPVVAAQDPRHRTVPPVPDPYTQRYGFPQTSAQYQNGFQPPSNPPRGAYSLPSASSGYSATTPAMYPATSGDHNPYATGAASQTSYRAAYSLQGVPNAGATTAGTSYSYPGHFTPANATSFASMSNAYAPPGFTPSVAAQRGIQYATSRAEFGQRGGAAQMQFQGVRHIS